MNYQKALCIPKLKKDSDEMVSRGEKDFMDRINEDIDNGDNRKTENEDDE